MLILHANWTERGLALWAESLEACLAESATAAATIPDAHEGGAVVARPAVAMHAFAAPADDLARALHETDRVAPDDVGDASSTIPLRLPAAHGRPVPSDFLLDLAEAGDDDDEHLLPTLERFDVPCVRLAVESTLRVLLALEDAGPNERLEYGHDLRYWMSVARLVLEMLVDQRFIPTLIQARDASLRAAWHPWLHDETTRERVGALVETMPPVSRAIEDAHEHRPWPILETALQSLTDATVRAALMEDDFAETLDGREPATDAHVSWLSGLLDRSDEVPPTAEGVAEMLEKVRRWIGGLDETGRDQPLRLAIELHEPDPALLPPNDEIVASDVTWRLELQLVSLEAAADDEDDDDGAPPRVGAELLWQDPAAAQLALGQAVREAEELLLAELGRAARVYPKLESALSEAQPTGVDLTTAEAAAFLSEFRPLLEESGFEVEVPSWWGQPAAQLGARLHIDAPPLDGLRAGAGASAAGASLLGMSSLVNYRWDVAVGDRPLTMEEFQKLAQQRSALVRLHGQWVELRQEQLTAAATFFESRPGGEMTLMDAIQLAHGADNGLGLPVLGLDATGWVADLLGASGDDTRMPNLAQPDGFQGELRPYQQAGLSWLAFLDQFGLGSCLADDMGLGKTIQLIALLQSEREQLGTSPGTTLLIVPTSVIGNWRRELDRFAPELTYHVQHGPDRPVGDRLLEIAAERDLVITTFSLVSRDRETLSRMAWHRVVLDEAQYIKNPPTKQTATIRALNTRRRIALTGTPVENRLTELWSIMEFCNPGYLGPPGEFRRRFSVPVERHRDQKRAEQLRRLVRPFILRRLKSDPSVIDDLPPCVVTREYADLTAEQASLYERTVNRMLGEVGRAEGIQRRGLVLATLVRLKQLCNHPMLLTARGEKLALDGPSLAGVAKRSGKTARLLTMLEEVVATGDKAIIFTQFRQMGHLLSAMVRHELDTDVQFLHGGTPTPRRQEYIDRFQDPNGGVPIFILSLKAGGIGVNLTAANHVFHFDRWWNPAVENQATDRAYRIGQTRTVHVHKFVCVGTLEERIDQMIEEKTELARNIIGAGEDWLTELSTGQLRELLTLRPFATEDEE